MIDGPNLNFLGIRTAHLWLDDARCHRGQLPAFAEHIGVTLAFRQSNHEGELVDLINPLRSADSHYQSGGLFLHFDCDHRRAEDLRRADHRAPHFEHPRPR